jgi:zinc protease
MSLDRVWNRFVLASSFACMVSVAALAQPVLPGRARAESVGPFAKPPEVSVLPNGLKVITVPWQSPGIVAYYTLVRVGARDEVEKGHSGFAHLF